LEITFIFQRFSFESDLLYIKKKPNIFCITSSLRKPKQTKQDKELGGMIRLGEI
jgi:hypothetical protein